MLLHSTPPGTGLSCHACFNKHCLAQTDCGTASHFQSHVGAKMLDSLVSLLLPAEHVSPCRGLRT